MIKCLIAFILGWLLARMMGNGFSVGGIKRHHHHSSDKFYCNKNNECKRCLGKKPWDNIHIPCFHISDPIYPNEIECNRNCASIGKNCVSHPDGPNTCPKGSSKECYKKNINECDLKHLCSHYTEKCEPCSYFKEQRHTLMYRNCIKKGTSKSKCNKHCSISPPKPSPTPPPTPSPTPPPTPSPTPPPTPAPPAPEECSDEDQRQDSGVICCNPKARDPLTNNPQFCQGAWIPEKNKYKQIPCPDCGTTSCRCPPISADKHDWA